MRHMPSGSSPLQHICSLRSRTAWIPCSATRAGRSENAFFFHFPLPSARRCTRPQRASARSLSKVGGSDRGLNFGLACTNASTVKSSRFTSQSREKPSGHWGVFISQRRASTAVVSALILTKSLGSSRTGSMQASSEFQFQSGHGDRSPSSVSAFQVIRLAEFTAPGIFEVVSLSRLLLRRPELHPACTCCSRDSFFTRR